MVFEFSAVEGRNARESAIHLLYQKVMTEFDTEASAALPRG
jgi:hypothetical protein